MNKLITFKVQDGENEYYDYGIYDDKHTDDKIIKHFYVLEDFTEDEISTSNEEEYWRGTSIVRIYRADNIDDDKIKIMKDFGVAYEHTI